MSTQLETRRDYLVRLGLAKPGRGKFSNEAKRKLEQADASGIEFLDGPSPKGNGSGPIRSSVPNIKPTGGYTDNSPVVKSAGISDYLFPSDFCWPESEYRAVARVGGKKVYYSMRECCNTCRVSLVMCACGSPTIHGNIAVTIERR